MVTRSLKVTEFKLNLKNHCIATCAVQFFGPDWVENCVDNWRFNPSPFQTVESSYFFFFISCSIFFFIQLNDDNKCSSESSINLDQDSLCGSTTKKIDHRIEWNIIVFWTIRKCLKFVELFSSKSFSSFMSNGAKAMRCSKSLQMSWISQVNFLSNNEDKFFSL